MTGTINCTAAFDRRAAMFEQVIHSIGNGYRYSELLVSGARQSFFIGARSLQDSSKAFPTHAWQRDYTFAT